MRVPVSWLKDYVELGDDVRELAEKLTFCGIEVEGIETHGVKCQDVVVGEVKAVERHPQADRLTVCRVFDGTQELQVVCGAPNVKAGGGRVLGCLQDNEPRLSAACREKLDAEALKARRLIEEFGRACREDVTRFCRSVQPG